MKKVFLILCCFSYLLINAQNGEIEVINTTVNSKYAELGVTYLNNSTIIFASSKKDNSEKNFSKGRRRTNQHMYLELYKANILENGDLEQLQIYSTEEDNKIFESDISFAPDGKTVYFTWNNFYNTQKRKDSAKWKTLQIIKATKLNETSGIYNIRHLPFNSKEYSIRYPEVSKDGKKLFFVSDMPNGYGGNDIYVVDILENDTYSKPRNLGENINTKQHEFFPFVANDNTLYFSTYGHESIGNLDIFKSELKDGTYQRAENMGVPYNSKYDDFGFVINTTNTGGFFTSNRPESVGDVDIYSFTIKDEECLQSIAGFVLNEKDNTPLSQAKVSLFSNNELIASQFTQVAADFIFSVKCDTDYKIIVEKDDFLASEVELKTDNNLNFSNNKNILLTPVECVQTISGFILNEKDNKPLSQAKVSLFSNNVLIVSKFTQVAADFTFNIKCDTNYKIIVEKDEFLASEVEFKTDHNLNFSNEKNIVLTPVECVQTISGFVLNEKDNTPLSQVKVSLFSNNELIVSKFTQVAAEFTFNIKCDTDYKIIVEKDGFLASEVDLKTDHKLHFSNEKNIVLTPVECVQTISGFVLNEKDNTPLSQAKVSLFSNNELIGSKFTQVAAEFTFNIKCDTNYKIIVEKDDFLASEVELKTDNNLNFANNQNIVLTPVECVQTISGFVLNEKDNTPLSQAKVSLFSNNELIASQLTQLDSKFTFNIKCDTDYKIIVEKDGFLSSDVELKTDSNLNSSSNQNIILTPVQCNAIITGKVLDQDTNMPLPKAIVQIFNQGKFIKKLSLDSKATFNFKADCESEYTVIASIKGYVKNDVIFKKTLKNNEITTQNILLEPVEEFVIRYGQKMIKTDVISFDLDSDEISTDAAIEINKVIGVLISYPNIKIEIGSHTDSRAPDNYNLSLSKRRANATADYIISNGIDPSRLVAKGYGETQLVNKCSNGVPCPNAEHELNRRTEFNIIEE